MVESQELTKELEEQDAIAVTILLNSKAAWNQSAVNTIQAIRRCEKLIIDANQIIKQLYIETEFIIQSLSDIQRQKLDYEIVNNIKEGGTEANDKT